MNVLVSTSSFGEVSRSPLDLLEAEGHRVTLNPHRRQLTPAESIALLDGIDGLIAGTEKLGRDVLAAAPDLRVISRVGTGTDAVDLAAARERGLPVFNTPDAHVDAVAELVLAGLLATLRKLGEGDRAIRRGEWKKPMGSLLRGKTVGVVGLGRIGRALVALMQPFGVTVLAVDPTIDAAWCAANGVRASTIDELVPACDVITLNGSFSKATGRVLDAGRLAAMKPTAVVVNCARGGAVDEEALAAWLRQHPEAGAYLDTFEQEPYAGPLREVENVLLSAHVGSYAREARVRMEVEAVQNLLRGFAGGKGNVA